MKATELHARLGGTLHTLSAASWALHVSRWRPSTPARFDAEWELHPAERREVVVFNRRCYENRYSRAFGDVAYAYAGQVAQASPIEATAPCGELLAACNAALDADLNSCLQNWYEPEHWLGDHRDDERALVVSMISEPVLRLVPVLEAAVQVRIESSVARRQELAAGRRRLDGTRLGDLPCIRVGYVAEGARVAVLVAAAVKHDDFPPLGRMQFPLRVEARRRRRPPAGYMQRPRRGGERVQRAAQPCVELRRLHVNFSNKMASTMAAAKNPLFSTMAFPTTGSIRRSSDSG